MTTWGLVLDGLRTLVVGASSGVGEAVALAARAVARACAWRHAGLSA